MPGAEIKEQNGKHKLIRKTVTVRGGTIVRPAPMRETLREWMVSKKLLREGN